MEKYNQITNQKKPKRVIGDGAYDLEENYDFLERNGKGSYLKFNLFYQEEHKKNLFDKINFIYK